VSLNYSRGDTITRDTLLPLTRESWPRPAGGATAARWHRLAALGEVDLPLAKLVEPHHDALAIVADLDGDPGRPDDIWAVWAAEPPFAVLQAHESTGGWSLTGRKAFCSGATLVSRALVTASTPDGARLFVVALPDYGITVDAQDHAWVGPGMARAATVTLSFDGVRAEPLGEAGDYTARPGFWWGAIGIAAIWWGGARGVADVLEQAHERQDAHGRAHLGAVRADLEGLGLIVDAAARAGDSGDLTEHDVERLALVVRQRSSEVVESVLSRVGRALGPGPLAFDADHARRVADLQVFVRQHHAERDLERLGSMETR